MLEKTTRRGLAFWLVLGITCLIIFLYFYEQTRPEATLSVYLNRQQALQAANAFMTHQGFDLKGYKNAVTFFTGDSVYLKKTFGLKKTAELLRKKDIPCHAWEIRYFREKDPRGFYLQVDSVTGKINCFFHDSEKEDVGATLEKNEARGIAERFFSSQGISLIHYHLVLEQVYTLTQRNAHMFIWEKSRERVGQATNRLFVMIDGDRVGGFSRYLEPPEGFGYKNFVRELPGNLVLLLFGIIRALLGVGVIIYLFVQFKNGRIRWKLASVFAIAFIVSRFIIAFNDSEGFWSRYANHLGTIEYISVSVFYEFITALLGGLWMFILCAVADSLARDVGLEPFAILAPSLSREDQRKGLSQRLLVGYSLGFIYLGYVTVFYLVSELMGVPWKPIASNFGYTMQLVLPVFYPITLLLFDIIFEVFFYQLFIIAAAKKLFKNTWLAVILSAFLFAVGVGILTIRPVSLRILELFVFGLVWGWALVEYGVETVILGQFIFGTSLVVLPFLRAGNISLQRWGWGMLGVMALPLVVAWIRNVFILRTTVSHRSATSE